ncbi:MAG: response regulator [Saprospiraceae bacterium]|nr:response regulator [Saprospiraceae bacterium]MCB0625484.1 response regulator [Saprospiraceae bacterium]MCB0678729.1 response regulator [Saprospiraceae bacterium]MCB0682053.1 response regulator [Saprospiraceae bacterium]
MDEVLPKGKGLANNAAAGRVIRKSFLSRPERGKAFQKNGVALTGWLLFPVLFLGVFELTAQSSVAPSGTAFFRNYPPSEYQANNQNWAIGQDSRGVMYVGNSNGLLEYDGVSWRLVPLGNFRIVRSLAIDAQDRVFVGGYGQFGYLAPDSARQLQFVSLLSYIDESQRDFADVWQTLATPEGVYFVSARYIFRWDGKEIRIWPARTEYHFGFWVHDRFYVEETGTGLSQMVDGSLQPAPGGEVFLDERIQAMLPLGERMLIVTQKNRLFLYDGRYPELFATEADEIFRRGNVYSATVLSGDRIAIGTMLEGAIVIDANGRILERLDKSSGLQDDAVLALYEDRQRALWMGMQVGIARAETGSPFRYFEERDGIEGSAWEVVRHEGRLYFATIMGLFYLDEGSGRFGRVAGVPPQCWTLQPFDATLLVGTFDGIFAVKGLQGRRIADGFVFSLLHSQDDPNRVFAGTQSGLGSIYFQNGQWRDEGRIVGLDQEIRHVFETREHDLWLTDYFTGIYRIGFSKGYSRQPEIVHFDTLQGLPPPNPVVPFYTDRGLRFATLGGIFRFDDAEGRFFLDTALIQNLPDPEVGLFNVGSDARENAWLIADDNAHSGVARRKGNGTYEWDQSPFLRIASMPVFTAYPDPAHEQIAWICGTNRVVRYNGAVPSTHDIPFQTLIRQITAQGDSLLYGGAGVSPQLPELDFALNSLRFRYAAPSYDDESANEYQYWLEGYDQGWSDWTQETYKDYTGLPPGNYRFRVRARNIYGMIGEEAVGEIAILPPFYRTWAAYFVYALLLAGGIYLLWKAELRRIRKKHLREMKQLEYEKLKELDEMKSRFFANISHEFRTPLTLILGPVENLLSTQPEAAKAKEYQLIQRNAQRLLRLINQLLDLSKLDAGKMRLDLRFEDLLPIARGITYSFESLTDSKNVGLTFESSLENAFLYFDRDKLEQALTNLVSNAVKFTPEGGRIAVGVSLAETGDWLQIDVTDTGPGIPEGQLEHIFDRFFQGAEATRTEAPGTGIGLALVKELVELHQGTISVVSRVGQGTRFTIRLPFGKEQVLPQHAEAEALDRDNTLLLVEDNPDMRAFIREILEPEYRIVEAADGQEGMEKALELIPDLIVSDVMMPEKDGLELCDTLKHDERTSHIPIILLTAKASIESRLAGLERGADDYLSKPFNREELLVRTRNLLELRQRLRARYAGARPLEPAEDKSLQIEDAFLQKIRAIVMERLSEPDFEIDRLAQIVGMSRSQLFRKVKALTGQSPSLFIRAIRLQYGKELLETTEMNVSEVAYEVGFSTPAYFSDAFTEAFGMRPSQLKK